MKQMRMVLFFILIIVLLPLAGYADPITISNLGPGQVYDTNRGNGYFVISGLYGRELYRAVMITPQNGFSFGGVQLPLSLDRYYSSITDSLEYGKNSVTFSLMTNLFGTPSILESITLNNTLLTQSSIINFESTGHCNKAQVCKKTGSGNTAWL